MRPQDDAVPTWVRTLKTPPVITEGIRPMYWAEVDRMVRQLIGPKSFDRLSVQVMLSIDKHIRYYGSEQTRVNLILELQRTGLI